MEENKSAGNPTFNLKSTIEYELKFTDKGIELVWSTQNNASKLVALLISQDVAQNAKENINNHIKFLESQTVNLSEKANPKTKLSVLKQEPDYKKMMDRLNWTGKTVTGLDIFVGSFIEAVVEENTLPLIAGNMVPAEIETKVTVQDNPTEV